MSAWDTVRAMASRWSHLQAGHPPIVGLDSLAQNNLSQTIDTANWSELSRVAFEQSASAMHSIRVFGELFTVLEL